MTATEEALALLPAWVPWLSPLVWGGGWLLFALAFTRVALRLSAPKGLAEAVWPERARLGYAVAYTQALILLALPVVAGVTSRMWWGPLSGLDFAPHAALGVFGAVAGVSVGRLPAERLRLGEAVSLRETLRGGLATLTLRWAHMLLVVGLTALAPRALSAELLLYVAVGALAIAAWTRGAGLRLAAAMGLARPARPALQALVDDEAARAGVPVPGGAWEVDLRMSNALAFPHGGALAFTTPLLALLDEPRLRAVTAHELGHLGEPPGVLRARSAAAYATLALVVMPALLETWGLGGLVGAVVALYAVMFGTRRVRARMEQRADAHAHDHSEDPAVYAAALEDIYRANGMPAVMPGKGGLHGHLADRMEAAGATLPWPRPAPPPVAESRVVSLTAFLLPVVALVVGRFWLEAVAAQGALVAEALYGGNEQTFAQLADDEPDDARARVFYLAALEQQPWDDFSRLELVLIDAQAARCDEARARLGEVHAEQVEPDHLAEARGALSVCDALR